MRHKSEALPQLDLRGLARDFYFLPSRDIDVWLPASFPAWMRTNDAWHDAHIVGRLKPGVTLEHARTSMRALSMQVTAKDFRGPHSALVIPLREELVGKTRTLGKTAGIGSGN